jgi:hypothetical protein
VEVIFQDIILQFGERDKEKLRLGKGEVVLVFREASCHDDRVEVRTVPRISNLGNGGEWSASRNGSFISGEKTPGIH